MHLLRIPKTVLFLLFSIFFGATSSIIAQTKKIDSLIVALDKSSSDREKISILLELSKAFTAVDVDKKFKYANQYRILAEKNHIDSLVPMAYIDMGIKYGIKTEYDSAMYYFSKAFKIAKNKNIQSQTARAYVNIGFIFDRLDNSKASIENYQAALEIFKKLKHKKGLNQTYINLGSLYFDNNQYKIAEEYFRQAMKIAQQTKDKDGIAQGYFNIAGTSAKLGNNEKAYEYYIKSLKLREEQKNLNGIALAKWGLGKLYTQQGKYKDAQDAFDIALKNNRTIQNKYQESAVLLSISENYLKLKDYTNAEKIAKEALKNTELMQSKGLKVMSLELLLTIANENKNYEKALDYQSEIIISKDSLNLEKNKTDLIYQDFQRIRNENTTLEKSNIVIATKNITYKKAIYIITSLLVLLIVLLVLYLMKIKQKNKINAILQQQAEEISLINHKLENVNAELQVQNALTHNQKEELERINAVKNKFFSIVSHDLRSPIATLKMLFSSYFSGHLTQEEMNDLLKKLEETVFDTADFLDNLLEWSKSQLEGMKVNAEPFSVKDLVDRTSSILHPQIAEKKLRVENNIKANTLIYADKNMINVVLRNLLSNSIKFCSENDSITLNAVLVNQTVLISIKDTGIGIRDKEQKKLFQLGHAVSLGTSGEQGHQIGLVLCKDLLELNNGKIWFESTFGEGTTFFIELPTGAH